MTDFASLSDFWWMTNQQRGRFTFMRVTHHSPSDNSSRLDDSAFLETAGDVLSSSELEKYCVDHGRTNLHRYLMVWDSPSCERGLPGPQLLDIDIEPSDLSSNRELDGLDMALSVTRDIVRFVLPDALHFSPETFRVYFSGQKGFHVEIVPDAVAEWLSRPSPSTLCELQRQQHNFRREVIRCLEHRNWHIRHNCNWVVGPGYRVVLDRLHSYLRLHWTVNAWLQDGQLMRRLVMPLTLKQLNTFTIEKIVSCASARASSCGHS